MRVRIIGIGMGAHHLTAEAVAALRSCDYVIAADKGVDDPLLALRREICAAYDVPLVAVPDPERDRADPADYRGAVADWHAARAEAYQEVLGAHAGTAGFLVWGDPALYDSTIRIIERLAERLPLDYDVVPGLSAPGLLAARHRIVLHEIGRPVHITTARRLHEAVHAGLDNIVVMLGRPELSELIDSRAWTVWWGANLGTDSEQLVHGRLADVAEEIAAARECAARAAGWVMDAWLLRRSRT